MANDYTELFNFAKLARQWLDDNNLPTREELGLRILKVSEESGEAAQAWIGYVGQNPRKGISHTKEEVIKELADVIVTAAVAIESLGVNSQSSVATRIRELRARINGSQT